MSRRAATHFGLAMAAAVTSVALAGCGDGTQAPADEARSEAADERPQENSAQRLLHEIGPYRRPISQEPQPHISTAPPPRKLQIKELRAGSGPKVRYDDVAIVNYVGYRYAGRRRYDTSYGPSSIPYRVIPGNGAFIEGFERGIVGMRVDGRRQITIPPELAYGRRGFKGQVGPDETLVFVVDVEALEQR